MEALEEFQRQVQQRSRETVKERLKDLSEACGMALSAQDLRHFSEGPYRTDDGRAYRLGVKIAISSLGVLNFYLGIEGGDGSLTFGTSLQAWRRQQSLASDLWALMASSDPEGEHNRASLYFGSKLPEDELPNFEQHRNQAIDKFVDSITKAGGLKKYLPQ
jgi:hypothetical protein